MADLYEKLADTASKMLTSKGQLVTFTRDVEALFDPVTGKDEHADETTFTGYGVILPYDVLFTASGAPNDKVKLVLEATSTVPAIGDKVTANSLDYEVVEVTGLAPAGTVVLYNLLLKR